MDKKKIFLSNALVHQIELLNSGNRQKEILQFLLMHSLVGKKTFWDKWTKRLTRCMHDELEYHYQCKKFTLELHKLFWDKVKQTGV